MKLDEIFTIIGFSFKYIFEKSSLLNEKKNLIVMYKSNNEHKNFEHVTFEIERIYCSYCRVELKNIADKKKNEQVCSSCQFILNNSDYLVFNLHPDLNVNDIEAIKLLELKLNSILPVLRYESIDDITGNQFGIVIKDNKVIALYLDNADLLIYPDEINYFTNLQLLSLVNTKIGKIPESVTQLTNLEILYLRDNNLEFLPEDITTLEHLRVLDLAQNQIRLLPDNFGNLVSLNFLNVENNLLYCLPKSFKDLSELKILNLFDNQIKMDLIVDILPKNLLNCGIGGNCLSKRSLKSLSRFFKKKCRVHTQRQSWLKNQVKQLN